MICLVGTECEKSLSNLDIMGPRPCPASERSILIAHLNFRHHQSHSEVDQLAVDEHQATLNGQR
jgi:hypothetical protein